MKKSIDQLRSDMSAIQEAVKANKATSDGLSKKLDESVSSIQSQIDTNVKNMSRKLDEISSAVGQLPESTMNDALKNSLRKAVLAELRPEIEIMITEMKQEMLCEISDNNPDLNVAIEC